MCLSSCGFNRPRTAPGEHAGLSATRLPHPPPIRNGRPHARVSVLSYSRNFRTVLPHSRTTALTHLSSVYAQKIAAELGLRAPQVSAALELLLAGNTIPFVARYRKEATGELDEVQLRDVRDRWAAAA